MIECSLKIKFEPRDIWVGVYWTTLHRSKQWKVKPPVNNWLDVYICCVPMLPIKLRIWKKYV